MEMNVGRYKYRNDNIKYVKELFKDVRKAKGRLVAISNGGYTTWTGSPKFGYRVYFDKRNGVFNCQVYSQMRHDHVKKEVLREYSVHQGDSTSLDSVITAILYNEYYIRSAVEGEMERSKIKMAKEANANETF